MRTIVHLDQEEIAQAIKDYVESTHPGRVKDVRLKVLRLDEEDGRAGNKLEAEVEVVVDPTR